MRRLLPFHPSRPRLGVLLLALAFANASCRPKPDAPSKPDAPPAPSAPATVPAASLPVAPAPPATDTNLESTVHVLQESFAEAPVAVRQRIEAAIVDLHSGRRLEGIRQLKLVDADSSLSEAQQLAIRDVIRSARPAPSP